MKIKNLIIVLLAFSVIFAKTQAQTSAAKPAESAQQHPPEWAELFGGVPLPAVWQSAAAASDKISAALAEKKFDGIPDWAETIHLASHALQSEAKATTDERQANLTDAFRLSARIADDVTAAAWAGDVTKTDRAYQRMKLALAIAQRSLPNEIVAAPAQTLHFAKKERPAEKK